MSKNTGLTLIELLIAIAIIGILTAIAYPQYQQYITRTYRTRAVQQLLILSKAMHSYYLQQHSYLDATIDTPNDKHYDYRINKLTAQHYQLTAIPLGTQAKRDQRCGNLSINELGEKSISGDAKLADCWQ